MVAKHVQRKIFNRAIDELTWMLRAAATLKVQSYLLGREAMDYRRFEAETAHLSQSELSGTGVIATRTKNKSLILEEDVPLANWELSDLIEGFPLHAAAASYLFTQLEVFGNDVIDLIEIDGRKDRSWHVGISGKADLTNPTEMAKCKEAFGSSFGVAGEKVPEDAIERLANLKRQRNEFAHQRFSRIDYRDFLNDTLSVVCHISFLITDRERISVYPFEDHEGRFSPQSRKE